MAPTNSPPRDEATDADPEASRKRARLSNEPQSLESVHIEALAPEEVGAGPSNVIEIEDDDMRSELNMDQHIPLHVSFQQHCIGRGWQMTDAAGELDALTRSCKNSWLQIPYFECIAEWLNAQDFSSGMHIFSFDTESPMARDNDAEDVFLGCLATFAHKLIGQDQIFAPNPADLRGLRQNVWQFAHDLMPLCMRVVKELPHYIRYKLAQPSRKDSKQEPRKAQNVEIHSLGFLRLVHHLLVLDHKNARHLYQDLELSPKELRAIFEESIREDDEAVGKEQGAASCMESLVSIFGDLAAHEMEIKDAWKHMSFTLYTINAHLPTNDPRQDQQSALGLVDLVNNLVLKRISEKHPRALPRDFHYTVVSTCGEVIKHSVQFYDGTREGTSFATCFEVYKRAVRGDDDFLLPSDTTDPESLAALSGSQDRVVSLLLRAAWVLKAYKSFVFSSIMDIRSTGMTNLSFELGEYANTEPPVTGPLLEYAGRFLQAQNITKYIFSADSHASIVGASADIIGFLAQTGKYSDQETDIIWQSCTASVEADFVKASYGVLQHVCRYMGYDQLLYLLDKIKQTPVATLASNVAAVDTLAVVLRYLEQTSSSVMDQAKRLQPAAYCLDLLYAIYDKGRAVACQPLYHIVTTQMIQYAKTLTFDNKLRMIADCIASIRSREANQDVTAGIDILAYIIMEAQLSAEESSSILDITSANAQIARFAEFVQDVKSGKELGIADMQLAWLARIRLIVALLALQTSDDPHNEIEGLLFDHLLGANALDNRARDVAWVELQGLCQRRNLAPVARRLVKCYMEERVPLLPAEYITPALIEQMARIGLQSSPRIRVQEPAFETLVRVASTSQDQQASMAATQAVTNLLFDIPQRTADMAELADCQRDWIHQFVDEMCNSCPMQRIEEAVVASRVLQGLALLSHIYDTSKQFGTSAKTKVERSITVEDPHGDNDRLEIQAHFARPGVPTSSVESASIFASTRTSLAKMTAALQEHTGAAHNRVIVGGKLWDPKIDGATALEDIGLANKTSALVAPRYAFSSNIGDIFACANPVEHALVEKYDCLEPYMLQGPSSIMAPVYHFLIALKPSSQARSRVANPGATAADLFPRDRLGETVYSIAVLCRHLEDHARLAVVDPDFVLRSTRLIMKLFMDGSRTVDLFLLGSIADAMRKFLQEKPTLETPQHYFEDAASFAARIIDVLTHVLRDSYPPDQAQARSFAVQKLYSAMTDACRADTMVWSSLTDHPSVGPLHARLLLDGCASVSSTVADAVRLFCIDEKAPEDAAERYWRLLSEVALGPALEKPAYARECFSLATEVLNRNQHLRSDEAGVRSLVERILVEVWKYQHTEAPNLPLSDKGLTGLLRMLQCAVTMLKAFKKPLLLDSLPTRLFDRFLFPDQDHASPLIHNESRDIVFEVIKISCESAADFQGIAARVVRAISSDKTPAREVFPGVDAFLRDPKECTGLTNLGMTCYMNSLIQQLYANLALRKFIFDVPVVDPTKQVILNHVQELFLRMQEGTEGCTNTTHLCQVLNINTSSMEDVHDFYTTFLNKLEESMPDEESKKTFSKFYTGRMHEQIKGSCGHVSGPTTPFTEIAATVKNKASLEASMSEFVQGEPMMGSNQYRCSTCNPPDGKLVDAMKRTCLVDVPDNLTFCLKRGDWDPMLGYQSKINDRFDFPQCLDMAKYKQEYLEHGEGSVQPDLFELVGVIVHLGSLQAGHYWSYVRLGGTQQWVHVEDARAQLVEGGFDAIQDECFGNRMPNGHFKTTNGYVVFYRRLDALKQEAMLIQRPNSILPEAMLYPPKVAVPAEGLQPVALTGGWRYKIANLYSDQMARFVEWLIEVFPTCDASLDVGRSDRGSDAGSESRATSDVEAPIHDADAIMADSPLDGQGVNKFPADSPTAAEHLATLAQLCSKFLMHLVMKDDSSRNRKLNAANQSINNAVSRHGPALAKLMLDDIIDDADYLQLMWTCKSALHRISIAAAVDKLLSILREDAAVHYAFLRRLVHKHHAFDLNLEHFPADYWRFASKVACFGSEAVLLLLDLNYLERVTSFIMTVGRTTETGQLLEFMYHLLSEHVNLLDESEVSPAEGTRHVVDGAICLRESEWTLLMRTYNRQGHQIWSIGHKALSNATPLSIQHWQQWGPGRLVGLLASSNAYPGFAEVIANSLAWWYDNDEEHLLGMLEFTLHFCRAQADSGYLTVLVQRLAKNLRLWNQSWPDALDFFDLIVSFAHEAAVDSTPEWTLEFLLKGSRSVRTRTKAWLEKNMYTEPDPTAAGTSACVAATRKLALAAVPTLRNLRNSGANKTRYTELLESTAMAGQWLSDLRDAVQALSTAEKATLDRRLPIELDESRTTQAWIRRMQEETADWEGESVAFPAADARDTIEVSDDDFEDDDEFSEFDDPE